MKNTENHMIFSVLVSPITRFVGVRGLNPVHPIPLFTVPQESFNF